MATNETQHNKAGKVAPPVPPKSNQAKFAGRRAIFEQNKLNQVSPPETGEAIKKTSQIKYATLKFENGNANAPKVGETMKKTSQVKYATLKFENGNANAPKVGETIRVPFKHEVKAQGVVHTSTRWNPVGGGLKEVPKNATKKTNSPTPIQRTDSTSSLSSIEDASPDTSAHVNMKKVTFADPIVSVIPNEEVEQQSTASSNQADIDRMMRENIEEFEKNSNVESKKSNSPTVDDMLFGEINDPTPCIEPQKNEVTSNAVDELETVKFLKTLSEGEREKLGFSSPQSDSKNAEKSTRANSPLDWNPAYQGKKRFDRLKANPLSDSNLSSGTQRYSLLQRDRITHNMSKEPEMDRRSSNEVSPRQKTKLERDGITHEVSTEPKMERSSNWKIPLKQKTNLVRDGITGEVAGKPIERKSSNQILPKRESNREVCGITRNNAKNAFNKKSPLSTILEADVAGSERSAAKG